MARLLIQFTSDELADFRWASIDESAQNADIEWQQGSEEDLGTIASKHRYPTVIILPQQLHGKLEIYLPSIVSKLRTNKILPKNLPRLQWMIGLLWSSRFLVV